MRGKREKRRRGTNGEMDTDAVIMHSTPDCISAQFQSSFGAEAREDYGHRRDDGVDAGAAAK